MKIGSLGIFLPTSILIFVGCGELDNLKTENANLKKRVDSLCIVIDDLRNGADRLWALGKSDFDEKQYKQSQEALNKLLNTHPESPKIDEARLLLSKVDEIIRTEAQKRAIENEKALKQQERLAQQQKQAEQQKLDKATSKMIKNYDKIEEITWYKDQSSPYYNNYNSFYIYIGKKETGAPWLRWRVTYAAESWLFVRSFLIKYDGLRYEKEDPEFKRDNNGEGIWEWFDDSPSESEIEMLKEVANSKNATIRFNGDQHYNDRQITASQKQAILNVFDAYSALGGTD